MRIPVKCMALLNSFKERSEVRWTGKEWRTRCPAHDDNGPSCCIRLAADGSNTLVFCSARCEAESIVAALGLTMADLFHDDDEFVDFEDDFGVVNESPPRSTRTVEPPADTTSRGDGFVRVPEITVPADAALCDRVYSKVLAGLSLTDSHREDLRRRGLSDDELDRRGYRSLRRFDVRQALGRLKQELDDATLLRVPGFRVRHDRVHFVDREGLLVPVRDLAGRIIALKLRADDSSGGAKYTWVSSSDQGGPSPGSPPHVPLGTPARADTVRLTEGELKADVAFALSGMPTIGVPGVDQWKSAVPVLEAMQMKIVHVAFDMDAWTKPGVAAALATCVKELIK